MARSCARTALGRGLLVTLVPRFDVSQTNPIPVAALVERVGDIAAVLLERISHRTLALLSAAGCSINGQRLVGDARRSEPPGLDWAITSSSRDRKVVEKKRLIGEDAIKEDLEKSYFQAAAILFRKDMDFKAADKINWIN